MMPIFAQLIVALQRIGPITDDYTEAVQLFPEFISDRDEGPVPDQIDKPANVIKLIDEGIIMEHGWPDPMPRFLEIEAGLQELQWSSWPQGPRNLGSGAYGDVQLIFKTEDMNLPFPKRRMAALKIQPLADRNADKLWTEMNVMRCVRHQNIVDYYGAFVSTPKNRAGVC